MLKVHFLQVVHCRVHGLSALPSSDLHSLSVHTIRHSDDDDDEGTSNRGAELSPSPLSQCLADNFHYPHHCKVPDCAFMVAWRERAGETIVFNLTAKVTDSTMVWAAIGFSEDAKMVNPAITISMLLAG